MKASSKPRQRQAAIFGVEFRKPLRLQYRAP